MWRLFGGVVMHVLVGPLLLLLILGGCGLLLPYSGPPCTSCVGPYDLTLPAHREALGIGD